MSSTTKNLTTKRNAPKQRERKATKKNTDAVKPEPGESFEEFYVRVWNLVHDSYARAREAEGLNGRQS